MNETSEPTMRLPRSAEPEEGEQREPSGPLDPLTLSRLLALAGALLVLGTMSLVNGGSGGSSPLGLTVFGLAPYMALLLMGRFIPSPWVIGGSGLVAITLEVAMRAAVYNSPQRATAGLALVVWPLWVAGLGLPLGGIAGFLVGRLWGTGRAQARAAAVAIGVSVLGFAAIGLARPDRPPTAVLRRQALQERIGPARVVSGDKAFDQSVVSTEAAGFLAAELDGRPGDEIAVVKPGEVEILDGVTFAKRDRVVLANTPGESSPLSSLVRLSGKLALLRTEGGATTVRGSDGALQWTYKTESGSASPLRSADLDLDGAPEFYASTGSGVVRVDGKGRQVWKYDAPVDAIAALAPRSGSTPGFVVATGKGATLVLSDAGVRLGEIKAPQDAPVLAVFDTPGGRGVAFGGSALRVIGLDGRSLFDHQGEEGFRVVGGLSVRPRSGGDPYYVIVSQTPRDVARSRMLMIDAKGAELQNVVLNQAPGLIKSAAADRSETLLVVGSRLTAMRLRAR